MNAIVLGERSPSMVESMNLNIGLLAIALLVLICCGFLVIVWVQSPSK
ncbi:MAG: hypothetical protein H7Y37_00255 [Anaerolineae bacterium]|nr:hypothetical protein [Gloeobacterales cyanobacterium ES-bin-313]